jgi:hypothetical protein
LWSDIYWSKLTGCIRQLSQTVSPAISEWPWYTWVAGTQITGIIMHDQILDWWDVYNKASSDSLFVHLTGNETVSGIKTFTDWVKLWWTIGKMVVIWDDSALWDISIANTIWIIWEQDATKGNIQLWTVGNQSIYGANGNIWIREPNPSYPLSIWWVIYSSLWGFRFPDWTVQTTASTWWGGGWEVNTASNVWTWTWLFKQKTALDLQFKSIKSTDWSISITGNTNEVDFSISGWVGTVTQSVYAGVETTNATRTFAHWLWSTPKYVELTIYNASSPKSTWHYTVWWTQTYCGIWWVGTWFIWYMWGWPVDIKIAMWPIDWTNFTYTSTNTSATYNLLFKFIK